MAGHPLRRLDDDSLIAMFYEAASLPGRWTDVLASISTSLDAAGSVLFTANMVRPNDDPRFFTTEEIAGAVSELLTSEWANRNDRPARAIALDEPRFVTTSDLVPEEQAPTDVFRLEFLNKHGLDEEIGTVIIANDGMTFVLSTLRRMGQAPITRSEVDRFTRLRPHLARSLLLASRLAANRSEVTAQALETLGIPVIVLSSTGAVIAANDLFPFDDGYFTTEMGDALRPIARESQRLLSEAIACGIGGGAAPRSFPVFSVAGKDPYVAHLLPMPGDARDLFHRGSYILILTQLASPAPPAVSILRALFDLTPAEANVAKQLAEGATAEQIAFQSNRSAETIRTQIKNILSKTGTQKQSQLISLLLSEKVKIY